MNVNNRGSNAWPFPTLRRVRYRKISSPWIAAAMNDATEIRKHKTQRVIVFAKGDLAKAAEEAGADAVGQDDLAKKIKDGWTDFDVCIATPDMMGMVGPLGKVLGPRGLMPSPRAGTVTMDVARVIQEYKAGKVEFRNDKGANLHAIVGKLSFDNQKLQENVEAFLDYVNSLKPQAVKGTYIKSIALCATMSPSVRVAA